MFELDSNTLYAVGDTYGWSPDGLGCIWFDSEEEAIEDIDGETISRIKYFESDQDFEDYRFDGDESLVSGEEIIR